MRKYLGVWAAAVAVSTAYGGRTPAIHVKTRLATQSELEVTVDGAAPPTIDRLSLHRATQPRPAIHPTRIVPYGDGNEPLALAILYSGRYTWIGTDEVETEPTLQYSGDLRHLATVFDTVDISRVVPVGSTFALFTYGDAPRTHAPWSPIRGLRGAAFGRQRDYPRQDGSNLAPGVDVALGELERSGAPRKILLVVGLDQGDEPSDALRTLAKRAEVDGIRVYAISTRSSVGATYDFGTIAGTRALTINSVDGLRATIEHVLADVTDYWYASFDLDALHLHGPQDLVLAIDGTDTAPVAVQLAAAPHRWWRSRPLQVGVCVVLVGLIAVAMRWRVRARRAR